MYIVDGEGEHTVTAAGVFTLLFFRSGTLGEEALEKYVPYISCPYEEQLTTLYIAIQQATGQGGGAKDILL